MIIKEIEAAINDIKNGKMIILIDDQDREDEGDLVIAAEHTTPTAINFMATHARGLICLTLAPKLVDKFNLPLMTQHNSSQFSTNFTVSIDAKEGITTGISASDRAKTVLTMVAEEAVATDIVYPGHTFPLRANPHGVLGRKGQTEGSVDLAGMAGLKPAAVICEIMNEDGTMARQQDLKKFAALHRLKTVHIADLIKYRLRHDTSILQKITATKLPTKFGEFKMFPYETSFNNQIHLALIKGKLSADKNILVRIHSECLTGDIFGSVRCDCGEQLETAMQRIAQEGSGIIIYLRQEGRGIGLANKIKAYALQDEGLDTVEANHHLGFDNDLRDYGIAIQILTDLGVSKIRLLTNNPEKIAAFNHSAIEVTGRVALEASSHKYNFNYLKTKKMKMGHFLNLDKIGE